MVTNEAAPLRDTARGWLAKERTIAGGGFNRWLVPPAALAIHLCIGTIYGFNVFWLPLSKMVSGAPECSTGFWPEIFASGCNWHLSTLVMIFTVGIVVLGASAALFGGWLEHVGPRKAGVVAAVCWATGFVVSALGIHLHQMWIMLLGSGVIGGIGLGIGYISPVSTLIKWFPDRRGMATGMAIMGFGGGAMIGNPLAVLLMKKFLGDGTNGVMTTFLIFGVVTFVFMMGGALGYRVPAAGWKPEGWTPPATSEVKASMTRGHVHARKVWGIPQFWLVWVVLCMNVSAGIGVLAIASPMLQEVFGGRLIGSSTKFADLAKDDLLKIAAIAGGFSALLSLFNILGRFFWASLSDKIGRKLTYSLFFVVGGLLYASIPASAGAGAKLAFVGAFCIILSMYGGGFATVPAYLADLFGTQMVGAIHGRLLTGWSAAGVFGPMIVTKMREHQLARHVPREQAYNQTMYWLVAMLVIGLIANLLVRPVAAKHFMSDAELAEEKRIAHERAAVTETAAASDARTASRPTTVVLAWLAVGLPLAWGVYMTLMNAKKFFG